MPGKIKLVWIQNAAARKTTFRKRRASLLKKVEELSILTESQTCGIVFNSDGAVPRQWPSEADLRQVIGGFSPCRRRNSTRIRPTWSLSWGHRAKRAAGQLEDMKVERKEREMNQLMRQISLAAKNLDDLTREDACLDLWRRRGKVVK